MRIGISVYFQFSFFSAGSPQSALAIAETLRLKGHDIFLVNVDPDAKESWWDDIKEMKDKWSVLQLKDIQDKEPLDLLIEVGQHMVKPDVRQKITKRSVWLCRKAPLLQDTEASLFPFLQNPERNLKGISEVWVYDAMVTEDDIEYLEVQTRLPIQRVPYLWTPTALEMHRSQMKSPIWQQVSSLPEAKDLPFEVHIFETNTSSSSSCAIPLFISSEVKKKCSAQTPIAKDIHIHNADNVKNTDFFSKNVYEKVLGDISGNFVGRQRIADLVYTAHSVIIAHSRFIPFRPYLLDALWTGIPFIHNSPGLLQWFSKIDSVKEGYYPDNDIVAGKEAFCKMYKRAIQSTPNDVIEVRKAIMETISFFNPVLQDKWNEHVQNVVTKDIPALPDPLNTPIGVPSPPPSPLNETKTNTFVLDAKEVKQQDEKEKGKERPLRIGFCDMWDSFRPEYNQFLFMLRNAYPDRVIEGMNVDLTGGPGEECVDLLIFGPFGQRWQSVNKSIPKVHFTGENTQPIQDDSVKLNLGFRHTECVGEEYLRFPLWILEIDWFGVDADKIGNPKPIPIHRCTKVNKAEQERKKKFCAFVVTNPCQPMRNSAFHWLSEYKQVDSAGRLFNNVGDAIFAGLGGGGGELKKHEFLKDYKFCIAYENESSPGYTTEKLLHAKAAGCIPIYWGDPKVERDFTMSGVLDARNVTTPKELVDLVKKVDEDETLWNKMYETPLLDSIQRDLARRTLSECARRMLSLMGVAKDVLDKIPIFLGKEDDSVHENQDENKQDKKKEDKKEDKKEEIKSSSNMNEMVFVTAASARFLPSLQLWLQSLQPQKEANPGTKVIVYMMEDVRDAVLQQYVENFSFAEYRRFPDDPPPANFLDLWHPQHFAWKIWIYQQLVQEEELKGKLIFYSDAGCMMCRYPRDWLQKAAETGFCVLEDPRQENRRWCHDTFVKEMKMTEAELNAQQIVAGILAFVSGSPTAVQLFREAWSLAQRRELIVGPKFAGVNAAGQPTGHRHDQSILSLLTHRYSIARYPLDSVYCDTSLRQTFLSGRSLYCHRGGFKLHEPYLEGIDEPWIINLDRRPDRFEKFKKTHPKIAERLLRLPAFDGKNIELTPKLARLFKPHDFNWKKSVMGCALSHLAMWMKLVNDKPEVNSYLILEDDARLQPDWEERWKDMIAEGGLPADWDVVYLGGILPPNREVFEAMGVEHVNQHIAKVKLNQIFGQPRPTRYMHFCAYSYVLSKRGATKILEVLNAKGGYWTSADHMMCNIHDLLNIYFLHPLPGGCYQDDDPVYCSSAFNDFSRKDSFDSDLWNNTECFTEEEVEKAMQEGEKNDLDILGALEDARTSQNKSFENKPVGQTKEVVEKKPMEETKEQDTNKEENVIGKEEQQKAKEELLELQKEKKRRFVTIVGPKKDMSEFYEFSWFKQLFHENAKLSLEIEDLSGKPPAKDEPIIILQRPDTQAAAIELEKWRAAGCKFYILHISDEMGTDPVNFYDWSECLGVIRNYTRPDVKETDKIKIIPLGFHWAIPNGDPYIHTPRPPFRELIWSFVGTGWMHRKEKLEILQQIPGNKKAIFQDNWDSSDKVGKEEMLSILLNSWCVPCPGGMNPETFRVYEALEAGAIPIIVKEEHFEPYIDFLRRWLPLLPCDSWLHAAQFIYTLHEKPEVYEQYRNGLLVGWENMKKDVKEWVKDVYKI